MRKSRHKVDDFNKKINRIQTSMQHTKHAHENQKI